MGLLLCRRVWAVFLTAVIAAAAAAFLGLWASFRWDLPTGPAIVCVEGALFGLAGPREPAQAMKRRMPIEQGAYARIHLTCIVTYVILTPGSRKGAVQMRTVNALAVRSKLGEILDTLERTGEPVLVSKGRQIRAVLITPEDFERRFVDLQDAEARARLLESIHALRAGRVVQRSSLDVLRDLRGYTR